MPEVSSVRLKYFCDRYRDGDDKYGFEPETCLFWEPFLRFFFEEYFSVQIVGLENVPANGRGIIIGNHSGGLPIDALLFWTGYFRQSRQPRRIRALVHEWLLTDAPFKSMISGLGGVPARFDVAVELLNNDEIVVFYPEGTRGPGKPYKFRYRLWDFDPGFVKAAISTGSPIIPIVTVGADDFYPILSDAWPLARFLGMPYFPVTPVFPWMPFCSSCLPLPARVLIKVGKPVYLDHPPEEASDRKLRLKIAREMQYDIQREINFLLSKRKSIFKGWDSDFISAFSKNKDGQ